MACGISFCDFSQVWVRGNGTWNVWKAYVLGSQESMDWFKGTSEPETMVFTIQYRGFRLKLSLKLFWGFPVLEFSQQNQSIEGSFQTRHSCAKKKRPASPGWWWHVMTVGIPWGSRYQHQLILKHIRGLVHCQTFNWVDWWNLMKLDDSEAWIIARTGCSCGFGYFLWRLVAACGIYRWC